MSHYELLGCQPTSNQDEIKQAYRRLALKCHPDKNNGRDDDFKKIAHAYAVLSDPIKRSNYDLTLPPVDPHFMKVGPEELLIGGERQFRFTEDFWSTPNGEPARSIVCPQCRGKRHFCSLCRGSRQVYPGHPMKAQRDQILQVLIPPRSWPGQTIYSGRVPVVLELISPLGRLSYVDGTLYYCHRVTVYRALLGVDEELVIAGERRHLLHPEPILPSSEIVVPEAGLYQPTGERGPLSIVFEIEFPKAVQPEQRRLLTECLEHEREEENSSLLIKTNGS